jgi:hypothetical protein
MVRSIQAVSRRSLLSDSPWRFPDANTGPTKLCAFHSLNRVSYESEHNTIVGKRLFPRDLTCAVAPFDGLAIIREISKRVGWKRRVYDLYFLPKGGE